MKVKVLTALFFLLAIGCFLSAQKPGEAVAETAGKPNVIFILTDDLDRSAFNRYTMPRTFRFIKDRGTTFRNHVIPVPTCCPSRANFMSGQYNHNNDLSSNGGARGGWKGYYSKHEGTGLGYNVGTFLQNSGYRTAFIGKYLNEYGDDYIENQAETSPPVIPGWDRWFVPIQNKSQKYYNFKVRFNASKDEIKADAYGNYDSDPDLWIDSAAGVAHYTAPMCLNEVCNPDTEARQSAKYSEHIFVNQAIRFLDDGGEEPKFIWYSTDAPHGTNDNTIYQHRYSWGGPESDPRDKNRYDGLKLHSSTPSFNEQRIADKPGYIKRLPRFNDVMFRKILSHKKARWRSLYSLDRELGRLYRYLYATGKIEDTVLVFTSDNGYMNGEHRLPKGKVFPYRNANEFPILYRGPGIPEGRTINALAANVDFVPTVLDIAQALPEAVRDPETGMSQPLDGLSLLPFMQEIPLKRQGIPLASSIVKKVYIIKPDPSSGYPGVELKPYRGVRTSRYIYVRYYLPGAANFACDTCFDGKAELYDLMYDPEQTNNLIPKIRMNQYNPRWKRRHPQLLKAFPRLQKLFWKLKDCEGQECTILPGDLQNRPDPIPADTGSSEPTEELPSS